MRRNEYKIPGCNYVFRSKLEVTMAKQLLATDLKWSYEELSFSYLYPISGECFNCGGTNIRKHRTYLSDFCVFLPDDSTVVLEGKGRFTGAERKKVVAIKESNEEIDFRMVFQYDNWLGPAKKKKYTDWCNMKNIPCAVKKIPQEWLDEFRGE